MAAASPSPAPPKAPPPLESTAVLAEHGRILSAHPRHFLILSLLFLPISFFPFLFPTFHKTLLYATSAAQIIPLLISSLFISTSYLLAIASITHSVRHAFFHYTTPLTLTSSIKSSIYSFPLFTTVLSAQFPVFGTLLLLSRSLFHLSEPELNLLIPPVLAIGFVILQLICGLAGLAYAVGVVESKWGFRAWKRSFDLVMMTTKVDPRNTGLGYYCRLVFEPAWYMGPMGWSMYLLPDGPWPWPWPLLVLVPCLFAPGLALTLFNNTMSFAVLYMMSSSLPVDEIENQVQAPLLVSVC